MNAFDAPTGTVWEWKFRNLTGIMLLLDGHDVLMEPNNITGERESKPFRRYFSLLKGRIANFSQDSIVNANAWPVE